MNFEENFQKMLSLTDEVGHPNTSLIMEKMRNIPALEWNSKILGVELAEKYYGDTEIRRKPRFDDPFQIQWRATKFNDFCQSWFLQSCDKLKLAPFLHRKLWEDAYILKTLETGDKLRPGQKAIGFGCGQERFPAYFASQGVHVLATDLDPSAQAAQGWIATDQHGSLEKLFHADLISRANFDRHVTFNNLDMNNIPTSLEGQFDFCWSVCAFEHLGSIEAGMKFVERSARLLRPGGKRFLS